jgi:hypothetical protein
VEIGQGCIGRIRTVSGTVTEGETLEGDPRWSTLTPGEGWF